MGDIGEQRPIRVAIPGSDGKPITLPPGIIRASGPLSGRQPNPLEEAILLREKEKQERIEHILAHTTDSILYPSRPTLVNRVSPDGALSRLANGIDAGPNLGTLTTILTTSASEKDASQVRVYNAANIAHNSHVDSDDEVAIIIQFPPVMPPDVQVKFDSLPDEEKRTPGPGRYNAYLQNGILPTEYIIGVINRATGEYQSREEYLATHS